MSRLALIVTSALLLAGNALAVPLTPGNLLVSTNDVVFEFTTAGTLVQSIPVEYPGTRPATESARDIIVNAEGNLQVYNGTFDPFLSTFDFGSESWSHVTHPGWSTVANVTFGGIDGFRDRVFVTDMRTFGDGGLDEQKGIVAFDSGGASRFAEDIEPIDLITGRDGLLYALHPGGSPSGRAVDVYDPETLTKIRDIELSFGPQRRSIAVDEFGQIFIGTFTGELFRHDPSGALLDTLLFDCPGPLNCFITDLNISESGIIVAGSGFPQVLTTDTSFSNVQSILIGVDANFLSIVPMAIPEPHTWWLMLVGLTLLWGARRSALP